MRIIGGTAKGRRLVVPKGGAVRPTAGKVKESLFNILPRDFSGLRVLDLFAGTGNVSIEALSRGAEKAVLVDASARSAAAIRENMRRLGFGARSQVWVLPVARALRSLAQRGRDFRSDFYRSALRPRSGRCHAQADRAEPSARPDRHSGGGAQPARRGETELRLAHLE